MQKLLVYQSMWAMERRRADGVEYPLEQKLEMIRDAGFDGVGFHDFAVADTVIPFLAKNGMTVSATAKSWKPTPSKPASRIISSFCSSGYSTPSARRRSIAHID